MSYIDGFLLPMPKKNVPAYKKMASLGAKVWMRHGALHYMEAVADDLFPQGIVNNFAKVAKLKPNETVVFAWILYKSRAHRDQVNKKVMADPEMSPAAMQHKKVPFDMKRMAFGGFAALVEGKSRA